MLEMQDSQRYFNALTLKEGDESAMQASADCFKQGSNSFCGSLILQLCSKTRSRSCWMREINWHKYSPVSNTPLCYLILLDSSKLIVKLVTPPWLQWRQTLPIVWMGKLGKVMGQNSYIECCNAHVEKQMISLMGSIDKWRPAKLLLMNSYDNFGRRPILLPLTPTFLH